MSRGPFRASETVTFSSKIQFCYSIEVDDALARNLKSKPSMALAEKLVSSKVLKGAIFLIISYLSLDSKFLTFWRLLGFRFPIRP